MNMYSHSGGGRIRIIGVKNLSPGDARLRSCSPSWPDFCLNSRIHWFRIELVTFTPSRLCLKHRPTTHEQKNYQLGTPFAKSYFWFTSSARPRIVAPILS